MFSFLDILFVLKYLISICLVLVIILAPAYFARINEKKEYDMLLVRTSSWLFGWTGVGWLFAMYWAIKK